MCKTENINSYNQWGMKLAIVHGDVKQITFNQGAIKLDLYPIFSPARYLSTFDFILVWCMLCLHCSGRTR